MPLDTELSEIDPSTSGDTVHANGSIGTTAANLPASAGNIIVSVLIDNTNVDSDKDLLVSFDGGTTFKTIPSQCNLYVQPRGDLTQFEIKGAVASCDYEVLINRKV